jgi:hypothetical protein
MSGVGQGGLTLGRCSQGWARATWWCDPLLLLSPSPSGYLRLLVIYEFLDISLELLIFRNMVSCGPFSSRILTLAANSPMIIKHVKTDEINKYHL